MCVGGLGVVDVGDPVHVRHVRDAVGVRGERPQAVPYGPGGHAVGAGEGRRGEGVGDVVRGRRVDVADLGEFLGVLVPVLDEGAVDQEPSTTPSWDGPGVPRVKPTARQPSSTSASRTRSSVALSATL